MKKLLLLITVLLVSITLSGCESSADRVSYNLSEQAEEFKILRDIRVINGITDELVFEGVGYCSIETSGGTTAGMLEVTCKIGEDQYTKDFFYLSDNIVVSVVQLEGYDVPQYHKQFVWSAQSLIPMFDHEGGELGE
jgi:hypothetical protein